MNGCCLKAVKGASPLISPDIAPSCESFFADEVNVGSPDTSAIPYKVVSWGPSGSSLTTGPERAYYVQATTPGYASGVCYLRMPLVIRVITYMYN